MEKESKEHTNSEGGSNQRVDGHHLSGESCDRSCSGSDDIAQHGVNLQHREGRQRRARAVSQTG